MYYLRTGNGHRGENDVRRYAFMITAGACAMATASAQELVVDLDETYAAYHAESRMALGDEDEFTAGLAAADFDGDGDLDLFVANGRHWPQQDEVWFNSGGGVFVEVAPVGKRKATAYGACPGDYDNDGDIDMVVARDQLAPVLYINDGHGDFSGETEFGRAGPARDCASADFDGDGRLDVALSARGASGYVVYGPLAKKPGKPYDLAEGFMVGVAAGDLDGDGRPDLLYANRGGPTLTFARNLGKREFAEAVQVSSLERQSRSAQTVDMDGDGDLDIVAAVIDGANVVVMNDGGAFDRIIEIGPQSEESYSVAIGDFNQDGRPDALIGNIGDDAIVLNTAEGFERVVLEGTGGNTYALVVGDMQGDGLPDFVLGNSLANNRMFWLFEPDEQD